MSEFIGHKCSISGAVALDGRQNVTPVVIKMADAQNNRGHRAAGVAGFRDGGLHLHTGEGTVQEALFPYSYDSRLRGPVAIGHTLYSTSGHDSCHAQPFLYDKADRRKDRFAFAFNGNAANFDALSEELLAEMKDPVNFQVDTAAFGHLLVDGVQRQSRKKMFNVFEALQKRVDGAFNIAMVNAKGDFLGYRDRNGFRPYAIAETPDGIVSIASENSAIRSVWHDAKTFDLQPGHAIYVSAKTKKMEIHKLFEPKRSHCFFEWIYFANSTTHIENVGVFNARKRLGKRLAELDKFDKNIDKQHVVVPVPNSGKAAASGYAEELNLREVHAILRKENVGRTFNDVDPETKVKNKFDIHPEYIRGREIVLVDDSIVRGTTMRAIVRRLREEAGASKIHLRIACPPILSACFYGIDFADTSKLIARKYFNQPLRAGTLPQDVLNAIARDLDVDSIKFVPLEAVAECLRQEEAHVCLACVNGQYRTPAGQKRADEEEQRISLLK